MKNTIAIPHLGASTPESEDNCAVMAARQLADFLENGNIVNSVNFPVCTMPRSAEYRLAIAHKNIPNMITSFATEFSDDGINIENMMNKSKGELAFTLIDTNTNISEEALKKIEAIEGVLRVTLIK